MIGWFKSLIGIAETNFVKTTQDKIGRIETRNPKINSLQISFGSFDSEGVWKIKKKVTISNNSIKSFLTKEQAIRELDNIINKKI